MINKLEKCDLNCNVFSVYDYDGLSMQELLCQFFTKINECIEVSNESLSFLGWLKSVGLKTEVASQINELIESGELKTLINETIFNELNNKIKSMEKELSSSDNYRIIKSFRKMNRDKFGFYSYDFVGDSITQGYDSSNHYSKSYFAYVRNAILKEHGSSNVGYVNMHNTGYYVSTEYVGTWDNKQDYYVLGNQSSTTSEVGATMKMWVVNPQKFFKINYSTGEGYGSFNVYNEESGTLLATINCNGENSHNNISQQFTFSEASASRLIKIVCKSGKIKINGVWFYDNIDDVMVNNYSRSGMALGDTSVELINDMTTGNMTFLALNHNDIGNDNFKNKLDMFCDSVKRNNGYIFMLDFRWGQTIDNDVTKKIFYEKYLSIKDDVRLGSYFCDMGKSFNNDINTMWELDFFLDDTSHPSDVGMMYIAKSICKILNLEFTKEKPINDKWNIVGTPGNPSFQNGHRNYTGYQTKYRYKDGVVSVVLALDSAYQGADKFIFYMPVIFRPSIDTRVCVQHMDGDRVTMHVGMDGKVYIISDVQQNHRFISFNYSL